MDALIIKEHWLNKILASEKDWEIRGNNTLKRGRHKLIQSGSGRIVGEVDIVDSQPLTKEAYNNNLERHKVDRPYTELPYAKPHYWEFANPVRYASPIKYNHPQGSIIWIKDVETREHHDEDNG